MRRTRLTSGHLRVAVLAVRSLVGVTFLYCPDICNKRAVKYDRRRPCSHAIA